MSKFNVGDLVKLNYSEHIGIVIESSDGIPSCDESQVYVYRIKWAVGEPYTWERLYNLTLVAGVNNEKRI
jgi:hypothetical protein